MADPLLRIATFDDIDSVLLLWAVAAENAGRPADTASAVRNLLRRDADALILASADAAIVGSVIAGWDGWRCHLYRLAVHPDWRRQGVGTALISAGQARAQALGAIRIDAMVLDGNVDGESSWRAAGYSRQSEWSRWVRPVQR